MTNFSRVISSIVLAGVLWPAGPTAQQAETMTPARGGQRSSGVTLAQRANMPAPQAFSVVLVLGEMQASGAADNLPTAARKALTDMKDFLPYKGYRLLDSQWTLCCGRSTMVTRLRGPEEQDYDLELNPSPTDSSGKWYVRFTLREPANTSARSDATTADQTATLAERRAEIENRIRALKERYSDSHPEVQKARKELTMLEVQQAQSRVRETNRRAQAAGYRHAIIDTSFTMDIGETVVVGTSRLKGDKALIALLTAVASTKPTR